MVQIQTAEHLVVRLEALPEDPVLLKVGDPHLQSSDRVVVVKVVLDNRHQALHELDAGRLVSYQSMI